MSDQAEQLRRKLMDKPPLSQQAKTIAVVSGKGGVGKSNIALNFSLLLSQRGKKVLLFDLDIGMGNIDILLGISSKYSITKLFEQKVSIFDMIETGPNALHYISGGSGLNQIFQLNQAKLDFFMQQLTQVVKVYDYIIFDMGAGVTKETIQYILTVDECVLVTTPEPTSITDAYSMIKHVLIEQPLSFHIIVNRVRSQRQGLETLNRLSRVVQQFLQQRMVPLGSIPDDEAVTKAVIAQQPFVLHNHRSRAAKAMENIVDQYLDEPINVSSISPASGFIQRFKSLFKER